MGWFGPDGECGCCDDCPIIFSISDCRLFWYINPAYLPEEPYQVVITTPSGDDTYENISGGMYEEPEEGTYCGVVIKDAVESQSCCIVYVECTPVKPCCYRTSAINIRITREQTSVKYKGGEVVSGTFYGAYSEAAIPAWDIISKRIGAMSAGVKTDENCYDLWGVDDFTDFEDVPVGSGYVTFYTGMPGYANAAAVPCSIPTTDYYYQRLYFDYYIRFDNNNVVLKGTLTDEDYSMVGSPGGAGPAAPTIPADYTFDTLPFGLCVVSAESRRVELSTLTTDAGVTMDICDGGDSIVYEYWPDVIPL
jgi:hypothetical protein